VQRHRAAFLKLIEEHIDILFANRIELLALFQTEDFEGALDRVRSVTGVAAITSGAHGSTIVAVAMFAAGWIGGGDAKLFAAVTLWLGWPACASFLMITALAGGALALLLLNVRATWLKPYLAGAPPWLDKLTTTGEAVPYGVAIAFGALLAFPQSSLLHGLHLSF